MDPGYTPAEGYGKLLPSPPPFQATDFEAWFFLFWAGALVVIIALPWAVLALKRRGDWLPLLALAAGFLTALGEPMLDLVGHLRWAQNLHGPAFSNFGIDIPILIPPCYGLFMGLEAYFIYTMIQRGLTVKAFFLLFAACGATDAIMEHPGVIMGVYEYYGTQPFEFYKFPFYWSFTNGVAICTIAVLIHYVWPLVRDQGWWKLAILPLGIIGTTMGEFGSGFPVFLAINADIPTWTQWMIGSLTLVISVLWIRVLAHLVTKDSAIHWTFWGLFKARFMLPHQREAYIQGLGTRPGTATPAPSAPAPATPVSGGNGAPAPGAPVPSRG
jgi:hypothetical protein